MTAYRPLVINATNGRNMEVPRTDGIIAPNPQASVIYVNEFLGISEGELQIVNAGSGSGTNFNSTQIAGWFGIATLTTGTNSSGRSFIGTAFECLALGNGETVFKTRFSIPVLSVLAQRYTFRMGFIDSATGDATDGAYLRYADNVNSGAFQTVTRSNTTETATNTGTTVGAGTVYNLEIRVNAAGTSVLFIINGSTVATHTTNIPTTAARATGYGASMIKSAGTTAVVVNIDYFSLECALTTTR